MYSDVFRMYPRARVGKPSDTIKIQHARCEYKRILTHEGSMTLRYKVPYTIQARYKQDTVEYRCIPDVATGYSQDTSKIQSNTHVSQMYPARQSSLARLHFSLQRVTSSSLQCVSSVVVMLVTSLVTRAGCSIGEAEEGV